MLTLALVSVGLFGGWKFWKSHPGFVARYETFAQAHFRLRTIIGARITTYIVVPRDLRNIVLTVITLAGYVTVWRWMKRKLVNRSKPEERA
jgi:hypothetical protein